MLKIAGKPLTMNDNQKQESSDDLKAKLLKDLESTGYPVELRAGNAFAQAGWTVHYNAYYMDWDERKGREIDLVACNGVSSKIHGVGVTLYLISEVKKSKDPWIIFTARSVGEMEGLDEPGWSRLHVAFDEIDYHILPADKIRARSTIHKFQRYGHSYYVAFGGSQSKPTIFEALTSSVKASEDLLRDFNETIKREEQRVGLRQTKGRQLWLIEPLVILDGSLYEAYLNTYDKLVINKINHIPICFGYLSPQYRRAGFSSEYVVEIVTMEGLPELLSNKIKWLNNMKRTIVNNISKRSHGSL